MDIMLGIDSMGFVTYKSRSSAYKYNLFYPPPPCKFPYSPQSNSQRLNSKRAEREEPLEFVIYLGNCLLVKGNTFSISDKSFKNIGLMFV